ncbi:Alpha-globin transcription factor CP2 [Portunus trituberculatus]|uniref:Alpha-globin transcription factor CP2 n=1 Tax=Portunus trituberculatus TaxID=210409 RepID=A0A5B7FVE8_PORTR|nr:Alpha-globin transcription factor CP2 [Portunus trituberculatus]
MERLYVCACQIKVFKLKGADRKHKQDREKIMKRSPSEQEKYQPSCECTILTELSPEAVYTPVPESSSPVMAATSGVMNLSVQGNSPPMDMKSEASFSETPKCVENGQHHQTLPEGEEDPCLLYSVPLHTGSTTSHTMAWLVANRFNKFSKMFTNFTGTDILRLSRSDLIEMCGIADGLRLFYALHAKKVAPRLTVVQNMAEESTLSIEVLQDSARERFRLLIRPHNTRTATTATSPGPHQS